MKRYLLIISVCFISFASYAQCCEDPYKLSRKERIDIGSQIITAFFASQQVQLLNSLSGKDTIFLYTLLTEIPNVRSLLKAQNPKLNFVDEEYSGDYYWYGTEFQLEACTTYETCKEADFLTSFIIEGKEALIGAKLLIIDGKWEVVSFDLYAIMDP